MKYLFLSLFISFITIGIKAQYVGLSNKEIFKLKKIIKHNNTAQKYYASFKKTVDEALNQNPNPVDTVVSEGHLATDPKKILTVRSLKDIDKIYALAIAYRIENDTFYLHKLIEFISAWALVNKPRGNPINDSKFEDLFTAYDLTKNNIPLEQKKIIDGWLMNMAGEEIKTGTNKAKTTSFNNWNSHRLKVIGCIAYVLDNDGYKKYIDEELPVQIEKNLLPDGSGFDFLERDALHYHVYTLEPLISLATVLKRATGKDYYSYISPSGASINKSISFLIPYVTGEKTHGEFVHSKSSFDKKRADNKEATFEIGANFKPSHGIPVISQAAYFHPSYIKVVRKVIHNKNKYPDWQSVLNAAKK
ncbi:MAG: alginate lyase [Chitinophagaceae bacterium]|nr:alginate lyase [Chitinophagaceae bacterium]